MNRADPVSSHEPVEKEGKIDARETVLPSKKRSDPSSKTSKGGKASAHAHHRDKASSSNPPRVHKSHSSTSSKRKAMAQPQQQNSNSKPKAQQTPTPQSVVYQSMGEELLSLQQPPVRRPHKARHSDRSPSMQNKALRSSFRGTRSVSPASSKAERTAEMTRKMAYLKSQDSLRANRSSTSNSKSSKNTAPNNKQSPTPQSTSTTIKSTTKFRRPRQKLFVRTGSLPSLGQADCTSDSEVEDDALLFAGPSSHTPSTTVATASQEENASADSPEEQAQVFKTPPRNRSTKGRRRVERRRSGSFVEGNPLNRMVAGAGEVHRGIESHFSGSSAGSSVIDQLLESVRLNIELPASDEDDRVLKSPPRRRKQARAFSHLFVDDDSSMSSMMLRRLSSQEKIVTPTELQIPVILEVSESADISEKGASTEEEPGNSKKRTKKDKTVKVSSATNSSNGELEKKRHPGGSSKTETKNRGDSDTISSATTTKHSNKKADNSKETIGGDVSTLTLDILEDLSSTKPTSNSSNKKAEGAKKQKSSTKSDSENSGSEIKGASRKQQKILTKRSSSISQEETEKDQATTADDPTTKATNSKKSGKESNTHHQVETLKYSSDKTHKKKKRSDDTSSGNDSDKSSFNAEPIPTSSLESTLKPKKIHPSSTKTKVHAPMKRMKGELQQFIDTNNPSSGQSILSSTNTAPGVLQRDDEMSLSELLFKPSTSLNRGVEKSGKSWLHSSLGEGLVFDSHAQDKKKKSRSSSVDVSSKSKSKHAPKRWISDSRDAKSVAGSETSSKKHLKTKQNNGPSHRVDDSSEKASPSEKERKIWSSPVVVVSDISRSKKSERRAVDDSSVPKPPSTTSSKPNSKSGTKSSRSDVTPKVETTPVPRKRVGVSPKTPLSQNAAVGKHAKGNGLGISMQLSHHSDPTGKKHKRPRASTSSTKKVLAIVPPPVYQPPKVTI